MTGDKLGDFIVMSFDVLVHGLHYVLNEFAYYLVGRSLGIPLSAWDWLAYDD